MCRFDLMGQIPLPEPLDLTILPQLNGPHKAFKAFKAFIPFILPGGGVGGGRVCGSAGRRDRVLETSTRSEAGFQARIASIVKING